MMKTILTIAATDCSGGAGINQDIRVIHDHNCWPITCITSNTLQTFNKVNCIYNLPRTLFKYQLNFIRNNFKIDAIKIGVITEIFQLKEIKRFLQIINKKIPVVLDPVFKSSGGFVFFDTNKIDLYKSMFNYITILTPNKDELELILQKKIRSVENSETFLFQFCKEHNNIILIIKGGHFNKNGSSIIDYIVYKNKIHKVIHPRLYVEYLHGTGCTFSTALACNLAKGYSIKRSVELSIKYVERFYTYVNAQYSFS